MKKRAEFRSMENKEKRARHAQLVSNQNYLISALPDDILGMIVSCLDMKEAARTSVLSHRWRYVWKLFSGCLDFEDQHILRLIASGERTQLDEAKKFRDWVYNVMFGNKGQSLEQLRIIFPFGSRFASDLTNWLYFAAVKKVRKLELNLCSVAESYETSPYNFDSRLLDGPPDSPSFNKLTVLNLSSVRISEAHLAYFLSTCTSLEQLSVQNVQHLQNVRVSGESLKLKHLGIRFCLHLENVEVSATSLASFTYVGPQINFSLQNVPNLSSVSLDIYCCEKVILGFHSSLCLSQLQKLELNLRYLVSIRCKDFPRKIPRFSNLEQLELKFIADECESLSFLSSFIVASPCLQKLKLKYRMETTDGDPEQLESFKSLREMRHKRMMNELEEPAQTFAHLKVIEFVGWVGREAEVQLANYLIKSVVSLEKIIFDLRIPCVSWSGYFIPVEGDRESAILSATQLEGKLPSGASLNIE